MDSITLCGDNMFGGILYLDKVVEQMLFRKWIEGQGQLIPCCGRTKYDLNYLLKVAA